MVDNIDTLIKVLYVEDNDFDAYFYQNEIESDSSSKFKVTVAGTLSEAEDILRDGNKFDVILLDLNLPDSRGLSTLTEMLNIVREMVPVVPLSGLMSESIIRSAKEMGASGLLEKSANSNFAGYLKNTVTNHRSSIAEKMNPSVSNN